MSRIPPLDRNAAPDAAKPLLKAVEQQLGSVPNFIQVLANAPVALEGFLGLYTVAGRGALDIETRERIALAVAEQNSCQYCVSAHTAIARSVGLTDDEIDAARRGASCERKAAAAVTYAKALVASMGAVSTAEFDAARAELSEEEVLEVVAHVALNLFTNMLGKSTRVEIDFPEVSLLSKVA
ncbi:carboxymuconolactone decarboxylase family protein [Chelativorans sp. YIM 93263]|uniref:carboxymuconolactone decarboxylase family protein n=1 Tax=Chelativorans sp. YIM 93263 TaxID=2906648 RepID=UPI002379ED37|nr:carboxymuconolactone decarboxylase family protein [Chelativorans sp. YIM 93263]